MDLSKQEMELFLLPIDLHSKNFFYHVLIRRASLTIMFYSSLFLLNFFNLYSSRSGGGSSSTLPCKTKSQVDYLMASGCLLIIISPNSLRWSSNHLLISNKILSQGLKVFGFYIFKYLLRIFHTGIQGRLISEENFLTKVVG